MRIFLDLLRVIWLFTSTMTKKSMENGNLCIVDAQVRIWVLSILKSKTSNNSAFGFHHGTAMVNDAERF